MKRLFCRKETKHNSTDESSSEEEEMGPPHIKWQHSWATTKTQKALAKSRFSRVPVEILLRIFQYLSVPDLCSVSLVCRRFKMAADQDDIWKLKCNSKFYLSFGFYDYYSNIK